MSHFRGIVPGTEDLPAHFHLPRHRHLHAYATVVLEGTFEEAGYAGRIKASQGDLLIHPVMDCHINRMISPGVKLLRLRWPDSDSIGGLYRIGDLDYMVRVAEKDAQEARMLVSDIVRSHADTVPCLEDWPDILAKEIKRNQNIRLGEWAELHGLARETVSRGFAYVWGTSPSRFRAEWRARSAWLEVSRRNTSLSAIAAHTGFTDQAHMTRWIGRIAGAPPSTWRKRPLFNCRQEY